MLDLLISIQVNSFLDRLQQHKMQNLKIQILFNLELNILLAMIDYGASSSLIILLKE